MLTGAVVVARYTSEEAMLSAARVSNLRGNLNRVLQGVFPRGFERGFPRRDWKRAVTFRRSGELEKLEEQLGGGWGARPLRTPRPHPPRRARLLTGCSLARCA